MNNQISDLANCRMEKHFSSRNRRNCFLSVRDDGGAYQHFRVPEEVYVYVRQLEAYIKEPEKSRLLIVYPRLRRRNNGDSTER